MSEECEHNVISLTHSHSSLAPCLVCLHVASILGLTLQLWRKVTRRIYKRFVATMMSDLAEMYLVPVNIVTVPY